VYACLSRLCCADKKCVVVCCSYVANCRSVFKKIAGCWSELECIVHCSALYAFR